MELMEDGRFRKHLLLKPTTGNPFSLVDKVTRSKLYKGKQLHITVPYSQSRQHTSKKTTIRPAPKLEDLSKIKQDTALLIDEEFGQGADTNLLCTGFDVCYQPRFAKIASSIDKTDEIPPFVKVEESKVEESKAVAASSPSLPSSSRSPASSALPYGLQYGHGIAAYVHKLTDIQRQYFFKYVHVRDEEHAQAIASSKQGSDDWSRMRRWRMGASEVGSMLGLSFWKTPDQAKQAKVAPAAYKSSPAAQRGTDNEDQAREALKREIRGNIRLQIERNLEVCFRYAGRGRGSARGRARRRLSTTIPDYHAILSTARDIKEGRLAASSKDRDKEEDGDDDTMNIAHTDNRIPPLHDDDDDGGDGNGHGGGALTGVNPASDAGDLGDTSDDFFINKQDERSRDALTRPVVRFYNKVHDIPNHIIHKWYNGDDITDLDILTDDLTGTGSLPRVDCPVSSASPDFKGLLWGTIKLTMAEIKWPVGNQLYAVSKTEHYAQCQQTMFIHEYDMMLYCTFSKGLFTITPFFYDKNYIHRFLLPNTLRIYFTELFPKMVEEEERISRALTHGEFRSVGTTIGNNTTGANTTGANTTGTIRSSIPTPCGGVPGTPSNYSTRNMTVSQMLKGVGQTWTWLSPAPFTDLDDDENSDDTGEDDGCDGKRRERYDGDDDDDNDDRECNHDPPPNHIGRAAGAVPSIVQAVPHAAINATAKSAVPPALPPAVPVYAGVKHMNTDNDMDDEHIYPPSKRSKPTS